MKYTVIDFETYDPCLKTYGMGWCFKLNYPEIEFKILGCGVKDFSGEEKYFNLAEISAKEELFKYLNNYDCLICHNATYDIGCLLFLFNETIDLDKYLIIDTLLLAKHDCQNRISYSLDNLCKEYGCEEKKKSNILHDYVWLSGLYQKWHKETHSHSCLTRPSENVLNNWCMMDLTKIPVEILSEYCLQDVRATKSLYEILNKNLVNLARDSDIIKICIFIKIKGIRIDIKKTKELLIKFKKIAIEAKNNIISNLELNNDFNINSNKQLSTALICKGHKVPTTNKGNSSLTSSWLEEQKEEIFKYIRTYRKSLKVEKDFLQKIIDYQKIIPNKYIINDIGYFHPTLKPYGASKTGRFTSGGGQGSKELSIHQIPGRDEEFGLPIREIFLPYNNEKLVCLDFSGQEARLQVHYAYLLGCTGAASIVNDYKQNPTLNYHQKVADITGLEKNDAKTINLGLSYGMGIGKLAKSLGTSVEKATLILNQYNALLPYMRQLQKITSKNLLKLGYIKTIGGRKLKLGTYSFNGKIITDEKDALSKLVQGSAADQCICSMILAYKKGLKIMFSVHDEIIISSSDPEKDLNLLKNCMENCIELALPMYAEGGIGNTWREAKSK